MNVIDGQAGLVNYSSLIFYSLTINNILNIVILIIISTVTINAIIGNNGIIKKAEFAKESYINSVITEENNINQLISELDNSIKKEIYEEEIANFRQSKINLTNAIALIQTAEEAMSESSNMLSKLNTEIVILINNTNNSEEIHEKITNINNMLEEIDFIANETVWADLHILNGSIFGKNAYIIDIKTRQLTLEIEGVRRLDLDLEQIGDLTIEGERYGLLQKIDIAIEKVNYNRLKLGAKEELYNYLIDYYDSAEKILSTNLSIDITKEKLAEIGMNKIISILERVKELEYSAKESAMADEDKKSILTEINEIMNGIDIIAEDLEFKEQKLLDGSYKDIPNLNSIGLSQSGEEFYIDLSTQDNIIKSMNECENAINKIESILAK